MGMVVWAVALRQMCFALYLLPYPQQKQFFKHMSMNLIVLLKWFKAILSYFEKSVQDIPKYWENT